jgi:hypothetical protein
MYVILSNPTKGGNVGFPDFDWLIVDEPQVLVWPNAVIESSDTTTTSTTDRGDSARRPGPLPRMKNEQLPVVDGELFGAHIWVREYVYDETNPCA